MYDLISRQAAIDAIMGEPTDAHYPSWYAERLEQLPSAQPEQCYDEWCTDCKEYDHERHSCPRWNRVIRETLKDAQPERRWIPCSERLPEIKQHVLLSCYGRVIYGRMISKDGNGGYPVFEICDSVGEKRPIVLETTVHSEFTTSRIIAWMPLPEPYQEEGEKDGKDT